MSLSIWSLSYTYHFPGVSSLGPPPTAALQEDYAKEIYTSKESVKTSEVMNFPHSVSLWDFGRRYNILAWVLSSTSSSEVLNGTTAWTYIMNNVDALALGSKSSEILEVQSAYQYGVTFALLQGVADIIGVCIPLLLTFFLLRPGFKRVYDERKLMFSLFTRIPRELVLELSRMRTDLVTVGGSSVDNGDIMADDYEDGGKYFTCGR